MIKFHLFVDTINTKCYQNMFHSLGGETCGWGGVTDMTFLGK